MTVTANSTPRSPSSWQTWSPADKARLRWRLQARPAQLPPEGNWQVWAYVAGRGTGKTRAGAEWVIDQVLRHGKRNVALVARTPADVRDVMIEGESGILACSADSERPVFQPSKRRVVWSNGAKAVTYSAEEGAQLRGPNHDAAWCDEIAAWTDAPKGDVLDTSWNNLGLALRSKRTGEQNPCVVTTTPKPVKLVKQVLAHEGTVMTRESTYANLANLSESYAQRILAYEGTRIGRQEIHADLLTEVEGALWTQAMIDDSRRQAAPDLVRIVVAIDPAMTTGDDADETGIVVAGMDANGHAWVLADRTCQLSPEKWARRAVEAYDEFKADRIVGEANNGGDMIRSLLRTVAPNVSYMKVTATRGKRIRAEPIASLYEQGRVHHVGVFNDAPPPKIGLEDQMTTWVPDSGESPDRMDALVWALTELTERSKGGRMKFRQYGKAG